MSSEELSEDFAPTVSNRIINQGPAKHANTQFASMLTKKKTTKFGTQKTGQ